MPRLTNLKICSFLLVSILSCIVYGQVPPATDARTAEIRSLNEKADKLFAVRQYAQAFPIYNQAALAGDAHAMLRVGNIYESPALGKTDYALAMQWYQKAHAAGSAEIAVNAATCIGMMYSQGRGVAPDPRQASIWFSEAAEGGEPVAMTNLGVLYFLGRGVPQDRPQAARWFRKASELGVVIAMEKLSRMYEAGLGIPKDQNEARYWYEKAAARGSSLAKFRLLTFGRATFDLTGEWDGFDPGSFVPQSLRIMQSGKKLTAVRYRAADRTKGTADYLRGTFGDDPYIVSVEVAQYPEGFLGFLHDSISADIAPDVVPIPSGWNATVLTLHDPDHFQIGTMTFERVSLPTLDDAPCYPDNPLKVQAFFALARGQNSLKAGHLSDGACWYRLGALQESTSSMVSFADLLRQGLGVKQDFSAARAWLEHASKTGDLDAMMELSSMDDLGEGAPVDHARAEAWRTKVMNIKAARLRAEREDAAAGYALSAIFGNMFQDPDCDATVITGDSWSEVQERKRRIEEKKERGECGPSPWMSDLQKDALATMMKRAPDDPIYEKAGRDLLALVGSNQFEAIAEKFNPAMKTGKVTPTTMRRTWAHMNQDFGAYRGIVASTRLPGKPIVDVLCAFERQRGNVRFVFDQKGEISGLWFQPAAPRFWPSELAQKATNPNQP
jgi:TPR repeat protein